jgi:hypothetical protein
MIRHAFSTSFVPRGGLPGEYMFYVTVNRFEDEKCVTSENIFQCPVKMVPEANGATPGLDWAAEMADLAWNVIVRERSGRNATPVRGANDRWRDTTEKPFLS